MSEYWSSSDFAYMCLLDERRTMALRDAIRATVRPGDRVMDVGSGTGILSLFAAQAGAAQVIAVEADARLAGWIRETVAANGFADRITVRAGNVLDPAVLGPDTAAPDVLIAELVETALIEETLVPVLNTLRQRGRIGPGTRVIPRGYRTSLQLVDLDETMYGLRIRSMRHEWPFYAKSSEWTPAPTTDRGEPVVIWQAGFDQVIEEEVRARVTFPAIEPGVVNAVRIRGESELTAGNWLGACNTLNGDKVYPLPPRRVAGEVTLAVRYRMGAGLRDLSVDWA